MVMELEKDMFSFPHEAKGYLLSDGEETNLDNELEEKSESLVRIEKDFDQTWFCLMLNLELKFENLLSSFECVCYVLAK